MDIKEIKSRIRELEHEQDRLLRNNGYYSAQWDINEEYLSKLYTMLQFLKGDSRCSQRIPQQK